MTAESTTATKYITIHVAGSPCSNRRTCAVVFTDSHLHITQHMTILTTSEYRAIESSAGDFYLYFLHVRFGIELGYLVALSCTEQVTGYGVSGNLPQGTLYAKATASH